MKVAVCTRHVGTNTGTGADHYVIQSLAALRQYDLQNQYVGYHEALGRRASALSLPLWSAALVSDVLLKNTVVPIWARARHVDALLHLTPPCCYTEWRMPQVCCVHDIPQGWENSRALDRLFNLVFTKWSSHFADRIVTVSEFSKRVIGETFGIAPHRISVVYNCTDYSVFSPQATISPALERLLRERDASSGYVLAVMSRLSRRKNPGAYVELFARLPAIIRRRHKLVVVAPTTDISQFVAFAAPSTIEKVRDDLVLVGHVTRSDLAGLYARAGVFLFTSRYEGFGFPPIEALACGTPVIATTKTPSLSENPHVQFPLFDPDDIDGMSQYCLKSLDACTRSTDGAREPREPQVLKAYSMESYAKGMNEVLRTVAAL